MTTSTGWQRKAILLFKSEKRLNADKIINKFNNKSSEEMKATLITASMCDAIALTHKPRTNDLTAHLENLKHQFIGKSELCFYHATLVVLLRRNYKVNETFSEFEALWIAETDYLLENLSLRWLVSACDTFVDHSKDNTRAAILMNATTLINTLKVYETQQFLYQQSSYKMNIQNIDALYAKHLPLYDGLAYFRIGADDTLFNMRKRYAYFNNKDKLATKILLYIFDKIQNNKSAFNNMRELHVDKSSHWW